MENTKPRPPLSQIIIYAIGQYGWSLCSFGAGSLLAYFYMPAEDGVERFQPYFFTCYVLGILTLIGLLGFAGRLLDAFTDPWIASFSDRMKIGGLGKRKKLMAIAALPFAVSSFLLFFPIISAYSWINILWLVLISIIYYVSFTMYLIPYNALIAELGHHPDDRMKISTVISLTWILGFATGFSVYMLIGVFVDQGYSYTNAFHLLLGCFALLSFICMMVPIFFLKENDYAQQSAQESIQGSKTSGFSQFVQLLRKDKNLRIFVLSDLIYWLAAMFIQMGLVFYITILMGKEEGESFIFLIISLIGSLLLYLPINIIVKNYGKKGITLVAFFVYVIIFGLTGFIDLLPIDINILFYSAAILAAFPMAVFGIIPNAIVADLIYANEQRTGRNDAGIYFAIRTFMMKIGITLANLIFPSLLLLGKSVENPTGVRATAVAALIFCIIGMFIFNQYKTVDD